MPPRRYPCAKTAGVPQANQKPIENQHPDFESETQAQENQKLQSRFNELELLVLSLRHPSSSYE